MKPQRPTVHFTDFRCSDAENLQQKFARLLKTAGLGTIDLADKFVAIKLHFGARTQHEVIRVAEDHRGAVLAQVARLERLHRDRKSVV